MLRNFRTYLIAVNFYRQIQSLKLTSNLQNQLERAASSIALNLAEGYGRHTRAEQKRYYSIAMGSLRECQAIIELAFTTEHSAWETLDCMAAHLTKLLQCYR